MSAQNFAFTHPGGTQQVRLPAGRYVFVRTAASAIDLYTEGNPGSPVRLIGIGAGTKFGPVGEGQGWRFLRVDSALAQNLEIIISDDGNFDVANTVTVSGSVTTVLAPSATLADTADTAQAAGTETTIAANLSRRRITIGVPSNAANSVRVSQAGGANTRGVEIQPGMNQTFETTAALVVRNADLFGTAVSTNWYALQES